MTIDEREKEREKELHFEGLFTIFIFAYIWLTVREFIMFDVVVSFLLLFFFSCLINKEFSLLILSSLSIGFVRRSIRFVLIQ